MRVIQRGNIHEVQLDAKEPDHRFRLARAFLSEAADMGGAWRVFFGLPEDWALFTKALQGIEGGVLLHATGKGLAALILDPQFCGCGREFITPKQRAAHLCEHCATERRDATSLTAETMR
jgi:hypothetical protein